MKRLITLALALILVLSMGACGKKEETPAATDGEIVLNFPTIWCGENVGGIYFEPAVERFNAKYEGKYHIQIEEVIESAYAEKLSQLAQAGKLPTLIGGVDSAPQWVEGVIIANNLYYPMNEFLDAHPDIKALCVDSSVEYCTQENGDIVSLPAITTSAMGLFYNSALYNPEKPVSQMSVDEFVASLGENKIAFQTVDNAWTTMLFYSALVANEEGGTELLQQYEGTKLLDFNHPCFINAAAKLQEIWAANASANSVGAAYADAANGFMSNQSAVICNGPWMNSEFTGTSGNWSNDFNGADVCADYYPGNIALRSSRGYGRYVMTNCGTPEERECAEAFLEFIFSREELELFALTEGCQVPNLEPSEEFMEKLSANKLTYSQTALLNGDTEYVPTVAMIMMDSVANNVFANDLIQLVNGVITPEEFCNDLTIKSAEAAQS